jgi:hypothetical protein
MSKQTIQRVAIGFLILAGLDIVLLHQRDLGMIFAAIAIALSLGANAIARATDRTGKGR